MDKKYSIIQKRRTKVLAKQIIEIIKREFNFLIDENGGEIANLTINSDIYGVFQLLIETPDFSLFFDWDRGGGGIFIGPAGKKVYPEPALPHTYWVSLYKIMNQLGIEIDWDKLDMQALGSLKRTELVLGQVAEILRTNYDGFAAKAKGMRS